MILRPYQLEAIKDICQNWHIADRVLYQGATGSGKTAIAQEIIDNSGVKTLFVVHRLELLEQNERIFDSNINVTVAMVQSLRKVNLSDYQLIVVDEAHHATSKSYAPLFETKAKLLGLTATPRRLDGNPLNAQFQKLILGPTIQELITDGYLAKPDIYVPPKTAQLVDQGRQEWNTVGGDYNKKQINGFFEKNQKIIYGDVIEHYKQLALGRKTIVFCPSVQSVYDTVRLFNGEKIYANGIDGSMTAAERASIIDEFRSGYSPVLVSCDLISEGFDMPDAYCAIMLRPTKSLTNYLQQAGRVLRMTEEKHNCIIIDHVNNTSYFGPPWIPRYWSLDGYKKRTKTDSITGVNLKLCLKCGNYVPNNAIVCSYCGNVFKTKQKAIKVIYEQLQKITIESQQKLIEETVQKIINKEKFKMLRTLDEFRNHAKTNHYYKDDAAKQEAWAVKSHTALQSRSNVFERGTLAEIVDYLKRERKDINNPEAYANGVMRKRLAPIMNNGTEEQKAEGAALAAPVVAVNTVVTSSGGQTIGGAPTDVTAGVPVKSSGKKGFSSFEQAYKFASEKLNKPEDEAKKFAQNYLRKHNVNGVTDDLNSGDKTRVLKAAATLNIPEERREKYAMAVLNIEK